MKIQDPMAMGAMMRTRRKQLGFTIEQMAEAVGLSPITVMRLELGRLGYIHERTAKALEVPAKVVKRMVMVATPVDRDGKTLGQERVSGDAMVGPVASAPMTIHYNAPVRARRAKLAPKAAIVERHGHVHTVSPLKKFLLWAANKV